MKQPVYMKTEIISKILVGLASVFVLGNAITQVNGGDSQDEQLPVITIHSTDNVARGETGSFVLKMNVLSGNLLSTNAGMLSGIYVNFSVSGTAIPGVDYVPLVSPAHIGQSGYGVILVKTRPNPRAPSSRQSYGVVVTLEPGPGYAVGAAKSAQMIIKP